MACGTGKTFTALRIAEQSSPAPAAGSVLFLVPSISLLSQSLREWSHEADRAYARLRRLLRHQGGQARNSEDFDAYDLAYPGHDGPGSSTPRRRAPHTRPGMTVVFSTYQSLTTVADAQALGLRAFDLVVCDEAHRTTGVTLADEDESSLRPRP